VGYAQGDSQAERVGAVKLVGNMSGGEMDMEDFVKE